MKRAKVEDGMLKYKNTGGAFHTANGRIIKKNEIFFAYPDTISSAFADSLICMEEGKTIEDVGKDKEGEKLSDSPSLYEVQKDKGKGKYNVINTESGKPLNDAPMTKKEAEELLASID